MPRPTLTANVAIPEVLIPVGFGALKYYRMFRQKLSFHLKQRGLTPDPKSIRISRHPNSMGSVILRMIMSSKETEEWQTIHTYEAQNVRGSWSGTLDAKAGTLAAQPEVTGNGMSGPSIVDGEKRYSFKLRRRKGQGS